MRAAGRLIGQSVGLAVCSSDIRREGQMTAGGHNRQEIAAELERHGAAIENGAIGAGGGGGGPGGGF